ncbi:MAG: hypothetical protein UV63_C0027G0011 [Microgenomates group bacterium GW2011_GWC1_43_11]|nr:MAG: hypothetical protein UV63_C0027G0011 [Microgenomates group bacterium GW2011_GWC1_43_11]
MDEPKKLRSPILAIWRRLRYGKKPPEDKKIKIEKGEKERHDSGS